MAEVLVQLCCGDRLVMCPARWYSSVCVPNGDEARKLTGPSRQCRWGACLLAALHEVELLALEAPSAPCKNLPQMFSIWHPLLGYGAQWLSRAVCVRHRPSSSSVRGLNLCSGGSLSTYSIMFFFKFKAFHP